MFGPIAAVSDQPLAQRPGPSRNGAPQLVGAATRAILGHRASSRMRYAWMVMCRKLTPMGLIPHERGKYRCPLRFPDTTGGACPIADPHFAKEGCTTTIATSAGARIRHQLDRDSDTYKALYAKRTMVERINSQAEALGLVRPKLRRGQAIVNQNTVTYVLINLRALARLGTTPERVVLAA